MTDTDLQLCRDWCRANGANICRNTGRVDPSYFFLCPDHPYIENFDGDSEQELYEKLGRYLLPLIQSVRNLDAMETEGPFKLKRLDDGDFHIVPGKQGMMFQSLSLLKLPEQSARVIAGVLNREVSK